jgi:hypothetical protein
LDPLKKGIQDHIKAITTAATPANPSKLAPTALARPAPELANGACDALALALAADRVTVELLVKVRSVVGAPVVGCAGAEEMGVG